VICPGCVHYSPVSQAQPIAPRCAWAPTPEQDEQLRATLPAPMLSRALVQAEVDAAAKTRQQSIRGKYDKMRAEPSSGPVVGGVREEGSGQPPH